MDAFVNVTKALGADEYELTLRETRTYEIIEDVRNFHSEIGILYLCDFNEKVIRKLFKENHLRFTPLFTAQPHVFISSIIRFPGAQMRAELAYPCLAFEQGNYNSFTFPRSSSHEPHRK